MQELPAVGRIKAFDATDGLGLIALDDGAEVPFGHDSLQGVGPDFDGIVMIHEWREIRALGVCAFKVRDAARAQMSSEDERGFVAANIGSTAEAVEHIGQFAVLFDQVPPITFRDWDQVAASIDGDCEFELEEVEGGISVTATVDGHVMAGAVRLAKVAGAPDDTPHSAFVSVIMNALAFADRSAFSLIPDPWLPDGGFIRPATKLALALLEWGGTAVHLPAARSVKEAELFAAQAMDPNADMDRGWEAWIRGGFDSEDSFVTYGMETSCLPDVIVRDGGSRSQTDRVKAGLQACEQMIYTHEVLADGEVVSLPTADGESLDWLVTVGDANVYLTVPGESFELPAPPTAVNAAPEAELADLSAEARFFFDAAGLRASEVIACGYFISPTNNTISSGVRARGWFIALTSTSMVVVQTRAPATSKPLLENHGVQVVDRRDIASVEASHDAIAVHGNAGPLVVVSPKLVNRYFPSQRQLVATLLSEHGGLTLEEFEKMQKAGRLKRWLLVAIAFAVGILLAIFR